MTLKKRTIRVMLDIDFSYVEDRTPLEDAEQIAMDLALNPNFDTIINGVSLNDIEIEEIDF